MATHALLKIVGVKRRKALAQIAVDPTCRWPLPTFGSRRPYRYWAHAHFDGDENWDREIWTLIVDLDGPPDGLTRSIDAVVYFLVEDAPHHLIRVGARFDLSCEQNHYTHGVVTAIIEGDEIHEISAELKRWLDKGQADVPNG